MTTGNTRRTIDKALAELAAGDAHLAERRLMVLFEREPADLALRSALARVHRAQGHVMQAGRWSYLDDERDPDEVAAFETGASALLLLQALRWPGDPDLAPTETARARLAEVLAAARAETGDPALSHKASWPPPRRPGSRGGPSGGSVGGGSPLELDLTLGQRIGGGCLRLGCTLVAMALMFAPLAAVIIIIWQVLH